MIYIAGHHIGTASALDHPRACFHKWPATVTASNSAPGADPAWLDDGETWSVWKSDAGAVNITLDFGETRLLNYVGIAVHDFDIAGSTIKLQADTGAGFADVLGLTGIQPSDDSAILFLLGPVEATRVRLVVTGDNPVSVGVMQAGLSLEWPRRATYTALPISESEQTTYRYAQSARGQILGTAVEAAELAFNIDIANLSEEFRQAGGVNSWQAFTRHIRDVGPMFVASRPIRYPEDVAYGVATERPRFNREIPNHRIAGSVSIAFKGYKRP